MRGRQRMWEIEGGKGKVERKETKGMEGKEGT